MVDKQNFGALAEKAVKFKQIGGRTELSRARSLFKLPRGKSASFNAAINQAKRTLIDAPLLSS